MGLRQAAQPPIQFTRSRPYKQDDNAHIEQKNWTHVRKLVGWERYESPDALAALNTLYTELRVFQNLFQPSMKLVRKIRHGSRLCRQYDAPQTPWARVLASANADPAKSSPSSASWPGPIPSPCPPESCRSRARPRRGGAGRSVPR